MNNTKITVITVCFNAENVIKETLLSVIEQTYQNIEYIVKDGNSKDGTIKIVREQLRDYPAVIISEADNGIYDAMNMAVKSATGEYCIFMNAGDRFVDSTVVEKIVEQITRNQNPDAIYGDTKFLYSDGNIISQKTGALYKHKLGFLFGGSICHQSFLAKTKLLQECPFSLEYKICADRECMISLLERGCRFVYSDIDIALCMVDGYSLQNVEKYEEEVDKCILQHFGPSRIMWHIIKLLKRNKALLKVGRKIFSVISKK